ncbi:MAG: Dam family site-specific DNA-(adenine-N6)-methyltransferase [Methanobacteriota archaeon]|nr:MAG: Dam family site-specific DNA-(adenine-N6)-methyltransferase [Euryarchaeota archaeon]
MKVNVPPIKSQGIKTKLVPWIYDVAGRAIGVNRWIEPFMGTGVVGLNIAPRLVNEAIMCDINPHIINFYQFIQNGLLTPKKVRKFLEHEGALLLESDGDHYYVVRERFNRLFSPLDFLFLSKSCFNGVVRFNSDGGYNVPFCRKPNRFSRSFISKVVNQVSWTMQTIKAMSFKFSTDDFKTTIRKAGQWDIVYCDPPYIGRNVNYFNTSWGDREERELFEILCQSKAKVILSTWYSDGKGRINPYIESLWKKRFNILTKEHFYHVGSKENYRSSVTEAIVTNIDC